ncbi:MAG: TIGR02099 family protein [Legionella sp.]|nr:MAG: TIGR02099 family protein [Legionella sp.]
MKRRIKHTWFKLGRFFSQTALVTFFRRAATLLAAVLVVLAIIFTLFRALTPWVKQYRGQIQQQLSAWTGQKIVIQDLETSWYWFTPVLRMDQVQMIDDQQHVLRINQVMVGINLLSSLLHWQIKPGVLFVDDVHFKIQQTKDTWTVEGFHPAPSISDSQTATDSHLVDALGVLLSQDKLIIKHVSADITLHDGTKIPLQSLNLKAEHRSGQYRIYSKIILAQHPETSLMMIANLDLNPQKVLRSSGQIYLSLKDAKVTQWQKFFPETPITLTQGDCSFDAWLDLKRGKLSQAQAVLGVTDVLWAMPDCISSKHTSSLTSNLAWKRLRHGWRLTADRLMLNLDGMDWPENTTMLTYNHAADAHRMYIKTLPLKQLLHVNVAWPALLQPMLALKPQGDLNETQISWQNDHLTYALTQFSHLSWHMNKHIPGVTELSGAFYWQPTEGRLEWDGEHTVFTLPKHPALTFDTFNASLEWKNLSQGVRVSLDRLVLSHPNLVLSASGAMDDPMGDAANLRLKVDFAAKEGQYWLPYIPSKGLKPKFDEWLKHDITHIGHASGQMVISGPWADFPFDEQAGEFSIQAHVNDVDLLINEDWPLNHNIDADIRVDKRTLSVDIGQADLMGVQVKHVNLSVPDIGLGKEVFLLHGAIEAPGKQIKAYVFSSPLKQRLSRWSGLDIEGSLGLDLNLEVPLYPESDHVYAKGQLKFNQNQVSIQAVDNPASFETVTGRLKFNEYGLTDGGLDGLLDAYPFSLRVQPLLEKKSGTELRFEGEVAVDYLKKLVHHPAFSLMNGRLIVTGLWTVYPNDADIDKLYINSSLVGMALQLPKPLGKSIDEITPVTLNMAFHPQHRMDLNIDYAQRLKGKLAMQEKPNHTWKTTGDLRLGAGVIEHPSRSGIRVTGSVAAIDVSEWQKVWAKWPTDPDSASLLDNLQDVDMKVGMLQLLGANYTDVQFKAHQVKAKEWSFHLQQKNMLGDFIYHLTKNNLSGHVSYIYIDAGVSGVSDTSEPWSPNMAAIPNLDLSIDAVQYHGTDIGKVDLNSSTLPGKWVLNTCTIHTPEYQLSLQGEWTEQQKKHHSTLEAQLHINNLAKSLEQWHITPAIDAHYGKITASGKWPAPFYGFSLKKLVGQLSFTLKNGRISHLDRQTEEKLGLGKLLSILSLQTIPRRLKLDFSDLSQQGYSFDLFKGNFQINKGVMSTSDSYIDGPVAYGRIKGDLDLVNQLYDVDLRISPYITASLPVVATIAGGPIAGLATLALSSLASKGMQKISGYSYKISGPWLNPVVQQVSIDRSSH